MLEAITLKIQLLGDTATGKFEILQQYTDNDFPDTSMSRIGIEYRIRRIKINNQQVKLQIWDTVGQERYHKVLISAFFRSMNGIVLVYDVQNQESFNQVENWMHQIHQKADPKISIVLVGNKLNPYADTT